MYYDAGGRIAMGTDAGTPFNRHGETALELEYMVDIGMSPLDALVSGTSIAADLLRESERGRIQSGCFADLLVVNGDPSEAITMASRKENHRLVVKNGVEI
jgi:imidazolonepropionase-like amidohydrolase